MKKWIAALCVFTLVGFGALFQFRKQLDVVAIGAGAAFDAVLAALPANESGGRFALESDGSARLTWDRSEQGRVSFQVDAQPFLDAGLWVEKSPYPVEDGRMVVLSDWSANLSTPDLLIRDIGEQHRDQISFHTAHNHYGLALGGGNAFEWAPDLSGDKDIVFVLDPEALAAAGVDVENVQGWTHMEIPAMENGKMVQVLKLVKPINL